MDISMILTICAVIWLTVLINRKMSILSSDLLNRCEDMKKLLLDLRNGTNTYFEEKRKAERIRRNVTIKVSGKDFNEFVKTVDLSEGGALIQMCRELHSGESIDMSVYLPLYVEPLNVKGRILRVSSSEEDRAYFETGVEFIDLPLADKDKLIETLSIIRKHTA
jgi:hypothetical protein